MKHPSLLLPLFSHLNLKLNKLEFEKESIEYEACTYHLNFFKIISRKAKITPKKTGQFVTIWKRDHNNITSPFTEQDNFDFFILFCESDTKQGVFMFPKQLLIEQNIVSSNSILGKRGIRVYPSWDCPTNKTAKTTQKWQLNYFINLST